jgi:hypothetical protein
MKHCQVEFAAWAKDWRYFMTNAELYHKLRKGWVRRLLDWITR